MVAMEEECIEIGGPILGFMANAGEAIEVRKNVKRSVWVKPGSYNGHCTTVRCLHIPLLSDLLSSDDLD